MSAKAMRAAQVGLHAETVLSGLEFSLGLARNHDEALAAIDSAIAQLEPVPAAPVPASSDEWLMPTPYRVRVGSTWQYVATWPSALWWAVNNRVEVELSPRFALEHPVMVDPYERAPVMLGPSAGQVERAEALGSSSGEP